MGNGKVNEAADRLKRAGFSDEFVADALRPEIFSNDHTDMGTGHSDFPKHQDLHLDMPFRLEAQASAATLSASLELREALNEWVRVINDRISQLERRVDSLQGNGQG
jgi:hypothetical protein